MTTPTLKKSVRKLQSKSRQSTASSLSDLQPEKNFFLFYKKNSHPVNQILSAQIRLGTTSLNEEDEKDLRQDVLWKLERCDIMGQFNPGKSAFSTFLTGTIRDYVKTWVRDRNVYEHRVWRPWPTQEGYANPEDDNLRYKRSFFSSMNGCEEDEDCMSEDFDLVFPSNFEDEYSMKEMVKILWTNVPEHFLPLMDALAKGMKRQEIGKLFSSSSSSATSKLNTLMVQLRKISRKILKDRACF